MGRHNIFIIVRLGHTDKGLEIYVKKFVYLSMLKK